MHTIEEIRQEYRRLDALCNVNTESIELAISKRSIRQCGRCERKRIKGVWRPVRIVIAAFVLHDDALFIDVIRHEYAHAVATLRSGRAEGHNAHWKQICVEIGCRPQRIAQSSETGKTLERQKANYEVTCMACGVSWLYFRSGKMVQAIKNKQPLRHGKPCGGTQFCLTELKTGLTWQNE